MRYVKGPGFGLTIAAPAPSPAAPAKPDVAVAVTGVDAGTNVVKVLIPPYDANAVQSPLAELRAYLVPAGSTLPADGPAFVASDLPFTSTAPADLTQTLGGAEVDIPLPPTVAGQYVGAIVLGFNS